MKSGTRRRAVFRALDDSPCVGSKGSDVPGQFSESMRKFCAKTKIPLATNCPLAEKAFKNKTKGTVLGIGFDSSSQTWFLAQRKAEKVMTRCWDMINSSHTSLEQLQKLMGSVNDLAQMCPLLKVHKRAGNALVRKFEGNTKIIKMVTDELKKELAVIAKVAHSSKSALPIAREPTQPSLSALTCYTDAAGASFTFVRGERICHNNKGRGVSCLMGTDDSDVWAWARLSWPESLLTSERDEKGVFYGSKSTMLESVGLLLPLLAFPEEVAGRNLIFMIDNIAVLYGWNRGYMKNDRAASEVQKSVTYLAAFLGVKIHVRHVPRMTDSLAQMADELSRKDTGFAGKTVRALSKAKFAEVSGSLLKWLASPNERSLVGVLVKEAGIKHPNYVFAE